MGILFNSITNQLYRYVLDANPIDPINRDPHIRCRAEWLGPVIDLTGVVRKNAVLKNLMFREFSISWWILLKRVGNESKTLNSAKIDQRASYIIEL